MVLEMETGDSQPEASVEKDGESDRGAESEGDRGADSERGAESNSDGESVSDTNQAWASVMTSILKVKSPKKKSIVLSKAKKLSSLSAVKKENSADENSGPVNLTQKQYWVSKGRKKPSVLEKDRERALQKYAVKGVVHLFNAVSTYQKKNNVDAKKVNSSQTKEENRKLHKKGMFSDANNQMILEDSEIKEEEGASETWDVLDDNFMSGTRLKDWDKEVAV